MRVREIEDIHKAERRANISSKHTDTHTHRQIKNIQPSIDVHGRGKSSESVATFPSSPSVPLLVFPHPLSVLLALPLEG